MSETWDLWYPKAGATGLAFARGRLDPTNTLLVHAAPPVLSVTVQDDNARTLATGVDLQGDQTTPIVRLTRHGDQIRRQDIWPSEDEIGQLVLLPGGEVGRLLRWWHAEDQSAWRWQVEFYNHL